MPPGMSCDAGRLGEVSPNLSQQFDGVGRRVQREESQSFSWNERRVHGYRLIVENKPFRR